MLPEPAVVPEEHHLDLDLDQQVDDGGWGWDTLPHPTPPRPLSQALPPGQVAAVVQQVLVWQQLGRFVAEQMIFYVHDHREMS